MDTFYVPTAEEIREATERIRETWSEQELEKRDTSKTSDSVHVAESSVLTPRKQGVNN